ncbi:hypothetical protein BS50DRAFT_500295 [Corynespora cassiicola Philippines]|uniref:Avirulence Effector AvrLm4-7 domain-containing protein n=1 Tax=Corynespora cassiicola Philippines TaxID=1448308 RepID=A0A2T2NDD9_CORCC|nr:hypothetical protein BS50DRAFT_500295 [Corynespora cassiicola Philippines]
MTEACRQKFIEWQTAQPCGTQKAVMDADCWKIEAAMKDYSLAHSRVWGASFTADNVCFPCDSTGQVLCTCTVRAWRYREWMYEPGSASWPQMPAGWERVDPFNGENGWYDTGHGNVRCD